MTGFRTFTRAGATTLAVDAAGMNRCWWTIVTGGITLLANYTGCERRI